MISLICMSLSMIRQKKVREADPGRRATAPRMRAPLCDAVTFYDTDTSHAHINPIHGLGLIYANLKQSGSFDSKSGSPRSSHFAAVPFWSRRRLYCQPSLRVLEVQTRWSRDDGAIRAWCRPR